MRNEMYPVRKEWNLEDEKNQLNEAISELDSLFVEAAESGNSSLPVERTVELAAMPASACEDVGELSRKRKMVEIGNDFEEPITKESMKGQPWTVEEHELFLRGLQKYGRGKWRMICWEFLKTRTPIQVASHAQKYFNRPKIPSKKRRTSIHDIRLPNTSAVENTGIVATPLSKHEIFTNTNSNVFDRHVPNPNICTELPTMSFGGHQQPFNPSIQYSLMFDFEDGV